MEEIISKATLIHKDNYLYKEKRGYKLKILCKRCNDCFWQRIDHHLSGCGCPNCARIKSRLTHKDFIKKARIIHGIKYHYLSFYTNSRTKIYIYCNRCKRYFWQTPHSHLKGHGCSVCAGSEKMTMEAFCNAATSIHGDKYKYFGRYINNQTKIKILCLKCNKYFWQSPNAHLSGHGCPLCRKSNGECKIKEFLDKNNINYEMYKKFKDCKNPKSNRKLSYDFYIEDVRLLIEYDGIFHYEVNFHKNERNNVKELKNTQYRDSIKTKYAVKNNLSLLRIPYWEFNNIEKILEEKIINVA